jgi:hypothetical protein
MLEIIFLPTMAGLPSVLLHFRMSVRQKFLLQPGTNSGVLSVILRLYKNIVSQTMRSLFHSISLRESLLC